MTTRRRGLVPVILRLGFLAVVAAAAWCAYNLAATSSAHAAEDPPAASATSAADLVRVLLDPPSDQTPPGERSGPPAVAEPAEQPTRSVGGQPARDDAPPDRTSHDPQSIEPTPSERAVVPAAPGLGDGATPPDQAADEPPRGQPDLTSVLDLLEPVLDLLEPVVGPLQPTPASTPTEPIPQPDPTASSAPAVGPAPPDTPGPVDLRPGGVAPAPSADRVTRHGVVPAAAAIRSQVGDEVADGGQSDRDRQAERSPGQKPLSPAPAGSGVDKTPTPHNGPADTAAAGWSPPSFSGRVSRSARTRRRPSRAPRPDTRPA